MRGVRTIDDRHDRAIKDSNLREEKSVCVVFHQQLMSVHETKKIVRIIELKFADLGEVGFCYCKDNLSGREN